MDPRSPGANSRESLANFDGLRDIRNLYKDEGLQAAALGMQFPIPYYDHRPQHLGMNGLDVMVVLIRHLYRHMVAEDREKVAEDEEENPLLRLAWCMFDKDRETAKRQDDVREDIMRWLRKEHRVHPSLAFEDLAESRIMVETMFSKPPFLLYHPIVPCKARADGHEWKPTRFHPKDNAASSLVTWDGHGDLGEFISNEMFGIQNDDRGNNYYYTFDQPTFIRVQYTNVNNTKTYKDLAEICVENKLVHEDGSLIPTWDKGMDDPRDNWVRINYRLIAAVRARDPNTPKDRDFIRRWHISGKPLLDPEESSFSSQQWKIGSGNGTYVLYYCMLPETHRRPLAAGELPEQTIRDRSLKANFDRMSSAVRNASKEAESQ
ncbi:hypothetical protein PFICI_14844 [Pestalotiopsis fici W106-1]|uniref:Uncharacterized protein n=1 Tax=Pestalotiopsis fici (strain W106-1 / CGMCC3.15140) TaxID=1229662 RepID=W3WHJ3_PESFW|nr:uncharacterized protein PFICI_14844 [Pestalotiopsis fici W106-1]ETS73239.1 hypothetical protein PFICI_14844 [Pestalotiopsis fici W106-1]